MMGLRSLFSWLSTKRSWLDAHKLPSPALTHAVESPSLLKCVHVLATRRGSSWQR